MATKEELLKEKEKIEKQLKELDSKEYSQKIVILFNPDLTEGRIPFYSKKEFYIKGEKTNFNKKDLVKLIEFIYSKKYGLYDGVMGSIYNLMKNFKVSLQETNTEDKNNLSVFEMNQLNPKFDEAIKQIEIFLDNLPIEPYL